MHGTTTHQQVIDETRRKIERAEQDVRDAAAAVRRDLDQIDAALDQNLRISATVASGVPFVESSAATLARAIVARQTTYDVLVLLERVAVAVEA